MAPQPPNTHPSPPDSPSHLRLRAYNSLPDSNCDTNTNTNTNVHADQSTSHLRHQLRPRPIPLDHRPTDTGMAPFAGRLGGNQSFVVDRTNPANAELLAKVPDAAPNLNLREMFDLRGFREGDLYKAALIECFGESSSGGCMVNCGPT